MQATHQQIRDYYHDGEGSRRVRISEDGCVSYYGSRDSHNHWHYYWHEGRYVEDYEHDTERGTYIR